MARNFARGAPPPPGSLEYLAVGDMFYPDVAARKARGARTESGWNLYEISFTDLDAAQNYVDAVDRGVKQSRRAHGDAHLSRDDERSWDNFVTRWRPFAADMRLVPGGPNMMLKVNKVTFDGLVKDAHDLAQKFIRKGMVPVPVPYAGELLQLLRTMPKKLTAAEMRAKLLAGVRCGERMLDENTTWFDWVASRDHLPLRTAVAEARSAADVYGRSREARATYSPGSPAYDEFLRRLTRIWIEAAGLYGINQTQNTAWAELKDDLRDRADTANHALWALLAVAGVTYLGVKWLGGSRKTVVVGVPDTYPEQG